MQESTRADMTIGLDLGDKYSHVAILDGSGELLEDGRVTTTEPGLRRRFGKLEPCFVALEVGTHSPWVSRLLTELGHEVIVANPRKVRLIWCSEQKDD